MAGSKSHSHVRSNSFPSDSHPLLQQCNEHLKRLGSSDETCSSSSLIRRLSGLEDLHDCVEKLLQLQSSQQAISQGHEEERSWTNQLLDGSLRLLDLCSAAKDAVLHTKEHVREISTIARRRGRAQVGLEIEFKKYLASRRVMKKEIRKALRSLKAVESKSPSFLAIQDKENKELVSVLLEVEAVSLAVFESLLSFISGPKAQSRLSGWSLVSKLVQSKIKGCEGTYDTNEFAKLDIAFNAPMNRENVQKDLQNLDLCVQDFEERLESMFRRLIKTRVSLLNILSN